MLFFEEKGCWHVFFIVEQKNLKPQSLSSWIFHCGIGCKNEDRKGHSKHLSTRKRPASRAQMSQGCIGMRFASQIRSRPLSPGTFVLDISTILLRRFTTVFFPLHKNSSLFCLGFKIESPSDIFCQSFPGENISEKARYMRVYSFSI